MAITGTAIAVTFGARVALANVSLTLPDAGVVGLVGPNGAGKSTLLDVLSGFIREDSGRLETGTPGVLIDSAWRRAHSARLHQTRLLPSGSVRSYLSVASAPHLAKWLIARRLGPTGEDDIAHHVVARTGAILESAHVNLDAKLDELSWGQARLVALAACLLAPKAYLLLDEPFAGLSREAVAMARAVISREAETRLVIVAEHDLDSVAAISGTVAVLVSGRLVHTGPSASLSRTRLLDFFFQ